MAADKADRLRKSTEIASEHASAHTGSLLGLSSRPTGLLGLGVAGPFDISAFGDDPRELRKLLAKVKKHLRPAYDHYWRQVDEYMVRVTREESEGRRAPPKPEALLAAGRDVGILRVAARILRSKLEAIGA